jgi:hypothetical protein
MLKTLCASSVVVVSLAVTGCDEKARQLATQTDLVLRQRSKELTAKTAAEVTAYHSYASLATENQRVLVAASLANDRSEQADRIAAEYLDNEQNIPLWRTQLAQYADLDYTAERQRLSTDLDATSLYLQKYEDISIEQDKVDALEKLLTILVKEPSLKDQITSVSSFAQDTKDAFDKDVCSSLKTKQAGTDAAAKTAAELYRDKKCDQILK